MDSYFVCLVVCDLLCLYTQTIVTTGMLPALYSWWESAEISSSFCPCGLLHLFLDLKYSHLEHFHPEKENKNCFQKKVIPWLPHPRLYYKLGCGYTAVNGFIAFDWHPLNKYINNTGRPPTQGLIPQLVEHWNVHPEIVASNPALVNLSLFNPKSFKTHLVSSPVIYYLNIRLEQAIKNFQMTKHSWHGWSQNHL